MCMVPVQCKDEIEYQDNNKLRNDSRKSEEDSIQSGNINHSVTRRPISKHMKNINFECSTCNDTAKFGRRLGGTFGQKR